MKDKVIFYTFEIFFRFLMRRFLVLLISLSFGCAISAGAQSLVVKTNALYWATTTPNVGLEVSIAPQWTMEFEGGYNPWTFNEEKNTKAKHYLVSPEIRYWFCDSFNGHFIGLNANFTQFNICGIPLFKDVRREGWAVGGGITYGCSWPISRCWSIEADLGLGVWYTAHRTFEARKCGLFNETVSKVAFGPTSLGLSFVFLIM